MVRGKISCIWSLMFILLIFQGVSIGDILYVDDNGPGGSGQSWQTAYKYLQDALAAASEGDEVRVAQGIYRPDRDSANPNGTGDREAAFTILDGMSLRGGYAGLVSNDPNAWDVGLYETILSGDLAGDDELVEDPCDFVIDPDGGSWKRPDVWNIMTESTRRENALHVVTASGVDQTAVLEGFTVTGGNAFDPPYWFGDNVIFDVNDQGGAIFNQRGSPRLISCRFEANSAMGEGGAIYNQGSSVLALENCSVLDNFSWARGAGMYNADADITMTGCAFVGNVVWAGYGAALYNVECGLSVTGCKFTANTFKSGSGSIFHRRCNGTFVNCLFEHNPSTAMENHQSDLNLSDCIFNNNTGSNGGGIRVTGGLLNSSLMSVKNCLFIVNRATNGAGILIGDSKVDITNSLFYGNRADQEGAGVFCGYYGEVTIKNSLFWNNNSPSGSELTLSQSFDGSGPSTGSVSYSLFEDGQAGVSLDSNCVLFWRNGNIDSDPLLVDPGYWDDSGTPDDPNDDIFVPGNYHLKSQAGRWSPIAETWAIDDETSQCIDAGDPNSPIGLEPFPNGGRINMGAYGGTTEASKSYFGEPPCETIIAGDINGDCRVDFADLVILVNHWLQED